MTVLVTGSTGSVGRVVVDQLVGRGIEVRALTRHPDGARFPDGVEAVGGELIDTGSMRRALDGVRCLFLLSPVTADELAGTLISLDLAVTAGVRDVVYLSVINADLFAMTPHCASKAAVERALAEREVPATVLRPGYYMQNDLAQQEHIQAGTYVPPIGRTGVHMIDLGDLGEAAANALVERQASVDPLPPETVDVAADEPVTGPAAAALWADALGHPVAYGGDDLDALEQAMASGSSAFMGYDMRLMMDGFQRMGTSTAPGTQERLERLLGHPLRTYREFVTETAASWG